MKDFLKLIQQLHDDSTPYEIEAGDDEMHIVYRHFGPEGQRMETTLIVTDIIEDELDH
jgi:hypothetical protein